MGGVAISLESDRQRLPVDRLKPLGDTAQVCVAWGCPGTPTVVGEAVW